MIQFFNLRDWAFSVSVTDRSGDIVRYELRVGCQQYQLEFFSWSPLSLTLTECGLAIHGGSRVYSLRSGEKLSVLDMEFDIVAVSCTLDHVIVVAELEIAVIDHEGVPVLRKALPALAIDVVAHARSVTVDMENGDSEVVDVSQVHRTAE